MTQRPRKKKGVEKVSIDQEFRRIAEKNLRKDRELLEKLAKIYALEETIFRKTWRASQEARETLAAVRKKIRELNVTREVVSREIRAVRKEGARRAR